ncbi:hypothetical protein SH580_12655 [Coraliomargarita algicola]|uniref:Uncharacterized protein n=1 Tax=Coraliomargarita algicola TaxID=3092156 RepID=A0ABZ0RE60_9BACT|nr:hypothetical protein [Coraliomargarita sp. J2-16]WPJ94286.1 hypothetical protein SH580_12655 [Coraliomargarita sp. J2-16]
MTSTYTKTSLTKTSVYSVSLAMLLLGGAALDASTVAHWRFEAGETFTDSSENGYDLTSKGTTNPSSTVIPASGNGSKFPSVIPQTDETNAGMVSLSTNKNFSQSSSSAFINNEFTFELYMNANDFGSSVKLIATVDDSWRLLTYKGDLILALYDAPGSPEEVKPSISLSVNVDYYIGVSVDLADTSTDGITFYVQDLTNETAMQTYNIAHTTTTLNASTSAFSIGSPSRYCNRVLFRWCDRRSPLLGCGFK